MSGRRLLPAIHPGTILREELASMNISGNALALALRVPATRINDILQGKRAISADTALRLGRFFGHAPQFWMNLQSAYELELASRSKGDEIARDVKPTAA